MIPDRFIVFYTQLLNWITKIRQGYVFDKETIYIQGNMPKIPHHRTLWACLSNEKIGMSMGAMLI